LFAKPIEAQGPLALSILSRWSDSLSNVQDMVSKGCPRARNYMLFHLYAWFQSRDLGYIQKNKHPLR
jgi:hypothetical protein